MKTVMGVDLGTQSIKVIVYNPETKVVEDSASFPFELIAREDGSREQLAEWWLEGFRFCLQQFSVRLKSTVVAIGVSGQQHGFVPVDQNGKVLAPVKLWCDTATTAECDSIMQAAGGEQRCIELGGNSIAAGFTASKILWLKNNKPDAYAVMTSVMLPHDYLNFFLTGNRTMECGDASGTGLLDVRSRSWSTELIEALDPQRNLLGCFPRLIAANQSCGTLIPAVAVELGLNSNVIVAAGGGDNMMAAIGTGNVDDGMLTASLGTSGTLFGYSSKPVVDADGELASFCSSTGGWLPLLCTMNCTVATEQLRDLFVLDVAAIDEMAASISVGADGVLTLPFYNGERTPSLPNGKAVIFGLDMSNTTQAHLLRSAMEAAVFGLKTGLQAFQRNGMHFSEVTLTGGGSRSALWRQIFSDVFNLPVTVLKETENAAFGAAIQSLWCYQAIQDDTQPSLIDIVSHHLSIDTERSCNPDEKNVALYESLYRDYCALLDTLSPLYKQ